MLPEFGFLSLLFATTAALLLSIVPQIGIWRNKPTLTNTAWGLSYCFGIFTSVSIGILRLLFCEPMISHWNTWQHIPILNYRHFSKSRHLGRTWRFHFILAFHIKSLVSGFCLFLSQKWPHFFCTNPFFTRLNLSWVCYFYFVLLQSIWTCISCPCRKGEISIPCCKILA